MHTYANHSCELYWIVVGDTTCWPTVDVKVDLLKGHSKIAALGDTSENLVKEKIDEETNTVQYSTVFVLYNSTKSS